jgi:hypothetical protein
VRTVGDYLSDVIPRVYMPVLRQLLTDAEMASLELSIRLFPDGQPLPDATPIGDSWTLFVTVCGETLFEPLLESPEFPQTDQEIAERFYSDLQDWISETSFGWGQLRGRA